jgi:hypothetical protein
VTEDRINQPIALGIVSQVFDAIGDQKIWDDSMVFQR